jgi:squalene monooxygenase
VINADLTIVADGCFSKFRKDLSSSVVTVSSHFVGMVLHDCPQHKAGYAEIILTPRGPVLVYQISSSATRILIDVRGKMPANMNEFLKDKVLPHLTGMSCVAM